MLGNVFHGQDTTESVWHAKVRRSKVDRNLFTKQKKRYQLGVLFFPARPRFETLRKARAVFFCTREVEI